MPKSRTNISAEQIDAILPQTQCEECGYKGCLPYANAIVSKAASLDLCKPGGITTLKELGELCQEDINAAIPKVQQRTQIKQLAIIDEDLCIGCTKCIKACPVDAIVGAKKLMHTVIENECTGCELCVAPCPMDCIEMVDAADQTLHSDQYRARYQARQNRLAKQAEKAQTKAAVIRDNSQTAAIDAKKAYINAALKRVRQKLDSN
ncbi:MAG: RnfABCDGE type electron transport complex subunit B [Pseudomonadota bacterium]